MKLTAKQAFCLRILAKGPATSWTISVEASDAGINRTSCRYEWADAPLRELRAKGLAVKGGRQAKFERPVHHITEAGLAALGAEVQP